MFPDQTAGRIEIKISMAPSRPKAFIMTMKKYRLMGDNAKVIRLTAMMNLIVDNGNLHA